MARIQILELPLTGNGEDMRTPFVVVIDQAEGHFAAQSEEWRRALITEAGARSVLITTATLDIPTNGVSQPMPVLAVDADDTELVAQLREDLDEARSWARHGYEIGQRHCGWADHGVVPAWLTDGWDPGYFGTCEHVKRASEYDTALSRVRARASRALEQDECGPEERRGYHSAMDSILAILDGNQREGRPA